MNFTSLFFSTYNQIKAAKLQFFASFFVIVLLTYAVLVIIDFVPEPMTTVASDSVGDVVSAEIEAATADVAPEPEPVAPTVEENPIAAVDPYPTKIIFDALDKEVEVLNPTSRSVAELDEALLHGVVRHPDSADLANLGNVFILGHSSYLPQVLNKNFQAFNGIQELEWGDTVRLQTGDMEYVYRVDKVYKALASEVVVPTDVTKARLTLATCNSFGSTDDRFMVEATLVDSYLL